jgi:hypothetical protein
VGLRFGDGSGSVFGLMDDEETFGFGLHLSEHDDTIDGNLGRLIEEALGLDMLWYAWDMMEALFPEKQMM